MNTPKLLQRPIYGGAFGEGRYSLATLPTVTNGLHSVRFLVLEATGTVLATGDDKLQVLAEARRVLRLLQSTAANDATWRQGQLWPDLAPDKHRYCRPPAPVSRRRRKVFDRCEARCFYCRTALTLDGKWHIEHARPRALGGGDDPLNLVAACPGCNLAKSDRTAVEFIAAGGGKS